MGRHGIYRVGYDGIVYIAHVYENSYGRTISPDSFLILKTSKLRELAKTLLLFTNLSIGLFPMFLIRNVKSLSKFNKVVENYSPLPLFFISISNIYLAKKYGLLVKRSRLLPFTEAARVRFPDRSPMLV